MEAVKEKPQLQKYSAYKNSGMEWLGEIPEHWKITPGFSFLYEAKEKNIGFKRKQVLSLSYGKIREKGEEELTGLVPESFETYQLVDVGDIIFRPTDLQNDKVSLRSAMSDFDGIITSAYLNLRLKKSANARFYHYFFRSIDNNKVIYGLGSGLRQNIDYRDFRRLKFPFPPKQEQTAIANFLDEKCSKIDTAIVQKQQLIELLKERRQIIIQNAVTKGLDSEVKMKDSGVEWIGEIPEHWEVKRLKYLINIQGGFAFDSSDFKEEGIQIIKIANTYMNRLSLKRQPTYVDSSYLTSHKEWVVSKNDILMSLTGTLGKKDYGFAILIANEEKYLLNQRVAKLTVKKNSIEPAYLLALLHSDSYLNQLYSLPAGTKQANLSNDNVTNIQMPIPPKNERESILDWIRNTKSKVDSSIDLQQQQIEKLKEYKSSLIDAAVTGKIKVS